ncbi:MAG: threonine synthase [Flavobacteriales bacterium]|jgi:threonine synthase
MKYIKYYQCTECGKTYSADTPINLCKDDGRPVQMVVDVANIAKDYSSMSWYQPHIKNMWRFGPLLPFDITTSPESVCTLGEGHTPIIDISNYGLCTELNLQVYLKDEGQPYVGYGANPTGSFKDRGMSVVASMACHYGLSSLAVPTQGNAGDSLSEYGVANGLAIAVIMPDDTPMPIMGKVAAYSLQHAGISLDLVKGTIREAGALMKQKYLPKGYFNCATFQEPGWRIEGKKTMGLELAEPWPEFKPEWLLPDTILYPTGGGTGILGMWKAFDELEQLGVIGSRRPKIIAIQSSANAPVVSAFKQGLEDTIATDGGETIATGINVPGGVGHKAVLRILRQSEGGAIAVSEETIAQHVKGIYQKFGIWISPEGAATVAALAEAKSQGLIEPDQNIVCFNTGSAEKYLPNIRELFSPKLS